MKQLSLLLLSLLALSACTYDEGITTHEVEVQLSEVLSDVTVTLRNNVGTTFEAQTDGEGRALFTVPAGIYSASVSKVTDDGYFRTIYNGSLSDIVVGSATKAIALTVTETVMQTNNPIVIKELYVGGCQKDDGSGIFSKDKCIVLYNNSSQTVSLDSLAFGILEPYNAESSAHQFLVNGKLEYADEDWVPAINGIWYFQSGHTIAPYSEVVVNIYGAIDNTLTYSQSINFANSAYFTMYDPEATSSDGKHYNNTSYYPSPSELIPSSHYLKAVKYGQGNAWPISQTSPAVILWKPQGTTPKEYAETTSNIIYPSTKQGNLIYACLRVPRAWVVDAVEVFNVNKLEASVKRLTADLDNGYVTLNSGYGHALVRKVERTADGHNIYQDTNNSTNDFYEADQCSLR